MSGALQSGDMTEVSRDITQLQQASQNLSDCQAVLGAREQSLSSAQTQLGSQNTQLQSLLSNDSDADLATVISQLTALQTAYQASLETIGADVQDDAAELSLAGRHHQSGGLVLPASQQQCHVRKPLAVNGLRRFASWEDALLGKIVFFSTPAKCLQRTHFSLQ